MPRTAPLATAPGAIRFVDLQAQRRRLGARLDRAMAAVLDHGAFIMGPEVAELEGRLAAFCGARHVVTCASGTTALHMALMAKGIGRGDAVFVPAFTFCAPAEAVVLVGATPVFVDVREDSFNLDPAGLAAAIETARAGGLRPAAVVPVDLFGQPADYRAIAPIAAANRLFLLADAAQSFGAELAGRRVGTLGDATAVSFYPSKPLGCYGDGGAVLTDDDDLAARLRSLRVHGQGADRYDNVRIGLNGRLDTLQAAVLIEKLAIFPDEIAARRRVADRYAAALAGLATVPRPIDGAASVWAQYTVLVDDRDAVAARLGAAGVPTAVHYRLPLHRQPAYRDFPAPPGGLPVAERLAGRVLSLPIHAYLDSDAQDRVIDALGDALGSGHSAARARAR